MHQENVFRAKDGCVYGGSGVFVVGGGGRGFCITRRVAPIGYYNEPSSLR
jgi:hypothetical protein